MALGSAFKGEQCIQMDSTNQFKGSDSTGVALLSHERQKLKMGRANGCDSERYRQRIKRKARVTGLGEVKKGLSE